MSSDLLDELADWIHTRSGVGACSRWTGPEGMARTVTEVDVHLAPHNLVLEPCAVKAETAEVIEQILAGIVAESPAELEEEAEADGQVNGTESGIAARFRPVPSTRSRPQFRVLGDVDIVGAPPIEREVDEDRRVSRVAPRRCHR